MATSIKQHHSFDFHAKISKKVAELTVVVHMLFKRNHEKEVEYEYFKMMMEKELDKIQEEYKKKIEWLEKQLDEQEAYRAKVEYQLGDMRGLEEKIMKLNQENDDARQKLLEKEELLRIADLEIGALQQKMQLYEGSSDSVNRKSKQDPSEMSLLVQLPNDQERISKSAIQLHLPTAVPENQNNNVEAVIKRLEDEMIRLKQKYDSELSKSYSEKLVLQQKIDNYTSSLSQEIDELKQTLNTLSSKQVVDQKKIAELDKEKRKLEENLKKSEADKKQLQRDSKLLRDQLKNAIKNNQQNKKNIVDLRDPFSQGSPNQRFIESVSILLSVISAESEVTSF